jgi:hypothetical protein
MPSNAQTALSWISVRYGRWAITTVAKSVVATVVTKSKCKVLIFNYLYTTYYYYYSYYSYIITGKTT